MCDGAGFFGKNPHQAKMTKNVPKTWFLDFLRIAISFIWNLCKMKVLMVHEQFAKTTCLGKIWFSSYCQKWLSANEISVFFNCEYFTNRLISDFDFWHVDRHEWKKQGSLTGFLKKILILGNGSFWTQTFAHPLNSRSARRIFLKFCTMKGANR